MRPPSLLLLLLLPAAVYCGDAAGIFGAVQGRAMQLAADFSDIVAVAETNFTGQLSSSCLDDLKKVYGAIYAGTDWAWILADAWGTTEAGYFTGNSAWEGNYDSCRRVATYDTNPGVVGQYCMSTWYTELSMGDDGIGVCMPQTCSGGEVKFFLMIGSQINKLVLPPGFPESKSRSITTYCPKYIADKEIGKDPSAIAAIAILCFFGVLVIIGTTFDAIIACREERAKCNMAPSPVEEGRNGTGSNGNATTGSSERIVQPAGESGNNPKGNGNKPGKLAQVICAFSVRKHIPGILNFDHPRGSFECLNGIRFLTFAWIVLGHTFQLGIVFKETPTYSNQVYKDELGKSGSGNIIDNMFLAVEAFFILSAFLTTVSFLKKMEVAKKPDCKMMSLFYFHRFWRLTPVYMMILMFYGCLFQYIGDGPLYPTRVADAESCKTGFWKNLFYINNIIRADDCMGWTWYLANDFQFYIISPVFLILFYYKRKLGYILTSMAVAGSIIIRFALFAYLLYREEGYDFGWYFTNIYVAPWTRSATYFMGMLLGFYMHSRKFQKVCIHPAISIVLWIVIPFACTLFVFLDAGGPGYLVFGALQSPGFGLYIVWVIFACISGNAGIINWFLSWRGWLPLARLSYVGYLLHPIIIYYTYYTNHVQLYMTDWTMFYNFLGHLVITLGLSFFISLFLELPFSSLERVMFPSKKTKQDKKNQVQLAEAPIADGMVANGGDQTSTEDGIKLTAYKAPQENLSDPEQKVEL